MNDTYEYHKGDVVTIMDGKLKGHDATVLRPPRPGQAMLIDPGEGWSALAVGADQVKPVGAVTVEDLASFGHDMGQPEPAETADEPGFHYFHFNLGDSDKGPLGLCATVAAADPAQALSALRAMLRATAKTPDDFDHELYDGDHPVNRPANHREYVSVYVNPDHITVDDIDEAWEA